MFYYFGLILFLEVEVCVAVEMQFFVMGKCGGFLFLYNC